MAAVRNLDSTGCGEEATMADPGKQWWTMADIADHWGVQLGTVWDYRNQTRHPRKPGLAPKLPPEDDMIGRTPVWRPATVLRFQRPGQGRGGGPRRDGDSTAVAGQRRSSPSGRRERLARLKPRT
jgi:hypothetical protein